MQTKLSKVEIPENIELLNKVKSKKIPVSEINLLLDLLIHLISGTGSNGKTLPAL